MSNESAEPELVGAVPFEIQTELSRDLGLTSALAIGVGTMIAAGIFTLSGLAVRNVGSSAILAFFLAALVAAFTALAYCEFSSIYPRSGEGYLYARQTFLPPVAYMVGWALFLGYTSSCAFYVASLSSYIYEFIWRAPFESITGIIILVALTLLNIKGTKESGTFQVVVTAGKVVLLVWFIFSGLGYVTTDQIIDKFSTDLVKIGGTAGMVFITFFGFSAIAASAGEVKNPTRTVPLAIFISMGVVTVLYTLVVLVIIAASLQDYSEAAMGNAARQFLGPVGGMVIVAGAIFSMVSASNASIIAGSRVVLSMGRLRQFPAIFGNINPRTRTPVAAVVLMGTLITFFAFTLPLEDLAHYADSILLFALTMVNVALIFHRRKYPDMERPFRVPLVPLLPALGIAANLYLLFQISHHVLPITLAGGSLLFGIAGFIIWRGAEPEEKALPGLPSRLAVERRAYREGQYRVLVPLANPANIERLIRIAASIAKKHDGEIVALSIAVVPDQLPPYAEEAYVERARELMEMAYAKGREYGIPVTALVRVSHNAARAILETARDRHANLIVMGWKGYVTRAEKIFGEMVEAIMTHARTNIILVKPVGTEPAKRFLFFSRHTLNSRWAEHYAKDFVPGLNGSLTVTSVADVAAKDDDVSEAEEFLNKTVARLAENGGPIAEKKLLRDSSVVNAILQETRNYDALILGASDRRGLSGLFQPGISEIIARRSHRTVLLVKKHLPVRDLISRILKG